MPANEDCLLLIVNVISRNGWIDIPAEGTSMFPFIRRGDICRFVSCEASLLKKGDVALCYTSSGRLIAHRFCKVTGHANRARYVFKGDTNLGFDEPVERKQIIGKLVSVRKNNKMMSADRFTAKLWCAALLSIPVSSRLLRAYLNRREHSSS